MPRHPPFALKNLTTKNRDKKGPHPKTETLKRGISVLSRYPTGTALRKALRGWEEIALEPTHPLERKIRELKMLASTV